MIYLVVAYVIFLLIYLPFNFYIVFRLHELRISGDRASLALTFYIAAIALVVFLSLIVIAVSDWSGPFVILR